ncbi:MAG: GDP-mannose 4,6-dehydratase [Ardenticatenia bacterium]|nr:GDP-mannose 4,6-dehydratase [Ardenticatenia bacterium]
MVTGGAGYIGSHLVDALIAADNHVTVLDNLSTGRVANIQHLLGHPRFRFVCDTLLNDPLVDRLVAEAEVVYHLAAMVGVKYVVEDPLQCIVTNVRGTEVVLECAYRYWRRVVVASSSEVYGKSEKVPLSEDDDSLLGPTAVGRWSYALAKALDEHLAFAYHRQGLPVSVVRYFNSYGPRLDPRGYGSVVARFISQALSGQPITVYDDGQQTRCLTYVGDTVRGTLLAASLPQAEGRAFNIGNGRETSVLELAQMVRETIGAQVEITHIPYGQAYGPQFEETRRRVPDTTRSRDLLGFEAKVSLEDGLQRTVDWFRKQR